MTISSTALVSAEDALLASNEHFVSDQTIINRPLVSIVIPAFNEGAMLASTLAKVCRYMSSLEELYRWEVIVVNDGSTDQTALLAEEFSKGRQEIRVVHHPRNRGLGYALRTGFDNSLGRYVVVLDCDLSYAPEHVGRLLDHIQRSQATIVVASPYAIGARSATCPGSDAR